MSNPDPQLLAKRRVGEKAAALVQSGMVVGLGTGSTAAFAIAELGRRVRDEGLNIVGVPTSFSAAQLARDAGIPLRALEDVSQVDLALDGADEVDPELRLIKGRGAAHSQEKVIESFAERFVVLVDESKMVRHLGEKCAVPLEILPFAWPLVVREVGRLQGQLTLRVSAGKDGPVISDQGNLIADARFGEIADPAGLDRALNAVAGIVEHGLFIDLADEAFVGKRDGQVQVLVRSAFSTGATP